MADFNEDKNLKEIVNTLEREIDDTEKEIKNYKIESTINENNSRSKIANELELFKKYKNKYRKLKKKYDSNNKNILIGDDNNEDNSDESTQSISFKSFNKIQQATRASIEMENMSGNILGDLNSQTGQMKGVSSKIGLINEDIDSSSGILVKMLSRQNRDKKIIIIFGIILFLLFLSVLIYKLVKKFK